ncbi:MAG: hypothetical protein BWX80_01214 [Candidatus Hydrogenedentes bacterium ADurb.Bin101]|nr:MAG: hypothetical protein BWX80_01214 [Candidatus Hydrogenedentes bacterium ADurb.Bin101]HOC69124.1 WD40 repeat domain-containing protein [Candidatus Hydrogenedentota bacterium]
MLEAKTMTSVIIALLISWCMQVFTTATVLAVSPAPKILRSAPVLRHLDMNNSLIVYVSGNTCSVYDFQNETVRWSREITQDTATNISVAVNAMLFRDGQGMVMVEKDTGKELWTRSEKECGELTEARFIGDTGWTTAEYDRAVFVYDPTGKAYPQPQDFDRATTVRVLDWLPGKEVLAVGQSTVHLQGKTSNRVFFWDPKSGETREGYDVESDELHSYLHPSVPGKLLLVEIKLPFGFTLKTLDASSGKVENTLENVMEGLSLYNLKQGGVAVLAHEWEEEARILNLVTGDRKMLRRPPGHIFRGDAYAAADGRDWILSQDEDKHAWLWAVEEGGTPRKVMDGRPYCFLPDRDIALQLPYVLEAGDGAMYAYHLETMERTARWTSPPEYWFHEVVCREMKRALGCSLEENKHTGMVSIFKIESSSPICTFKGETYCNALSKDGRYLIYNSDPHGKVFLGQVDTGQYFLLAEQEEEEIAYVQISSNNRHVAISTVGALKLITLEEGRVKRSSDLETMTCPHHQTGLCFSPDGTRLLFMRPGEAFLYDVEQGAKIHTFTEPSRFLPAYREEEEGMVSGALHQTKEVAGRFTDSFKETPRLSGAFSAAGNHVITMAAGKILRVWDAKSGVMLHAIETELPQKRNTEGYINNLWKCSENGAWAFAYNADHFAEGTLWEVGTGRLVQRMPLPEGAIEDVAVADDGSALYFHAEKNIHVVYVR